MRGRTVNLRAQKLRGTCEVRPHDVSISRAWETKMFIYVSPSPSLMLGVDVNFLGFRSVIPPHVITGVLALQLKRYAVRSNKG